MKPKLLEATLGGGRLLKRTSGVLIVAAFGAARSAFPWFESYQAASASL
jgi:hypothetical protein